MYSLYSALKDRGELYEITLEYRGDFDECEAYMDFMAKLILDGCQTEIDERYTMHKAKDASLEIYCKNRGGTVFWIEKNYRPELN